MDVLAFRRKYGLTQQELATKCCVTLRTVQNWESGSRIPEINVKLFEYMEREAEGLLPQPKTLPNSTKQTASVNMEQFVSTIERQQDIMSQQLEKMAQLMAFSQKRDEQIDRLIGILEKKI